MARIIRRHRAFFGEEDQALARDRQASLCGKRGVAVRACRLTPNHVHPILVPGREEALRRALGERRRPLRAAETIGRTARLAGLPRSARRPRPAATQAPRTLAER